MNQKFAVVMKRLRYALVSLLASNVVLLSLLLLNAIRIRFMLMASHIGRPGEEIPQAFQMAFIYGFFSFLGWLIVGLPIVLFVPANSVLRLSLLLQLIIGVVIGPFALLAIFVILNHGQLHATSTFTNTSFLWTLSMLMSTVAFSIYCALLSKDRP
jgi:Na+/H+ antiporter NhaC